MVSRLIKEQNPKIKIKKRHEYKGTIFMVQETQQE